jgi:hypothetical protein
MDKQQIVLDAVKKLQKSEFKATAIKIELEANLDRNNDENDCAELIAGYLAEALGHNLPELYDDDDGNEGTQATNPFPEISFFRFYNDGSVDSELTITVKLDKPENIYILPKIVEVWNTFCQEAGNGYIDLDGAGMHMALLNTSDASYPSTPTEANRYRFWNYRKSMTMLLPALYFLGTHCDRSRGLEYRRPIVSTTDMDHGYEKYAAVNYGCGALEFRVFDTCYDKPEAILDNFVVMANTMRYWTTTYRSSGMENICSSTEFGNDRDYTLSRFYVTTEHIDLLNHGLMRIKPAYKAIRELKQERRFTLNRGSFTRQQRQAEIDAENDYNEYLERFKWTLEARKLYFLADRYSDIGSKYRDLPTTAEKTAAIKDEAEKYVKDYEKSYFKEKDTYIKNYVKRQLHVEGNFTLCAG